MAGSPRHDETVVVGTGGRPPPGPVAGEVQGHRLIELIGGGGMAAVAAAEDPALGRRVAIKLLRGGDEEERRRFLQEARITAQLEHPAIVPVHAAGTAADGSPWYTMTLVRGRTLAEILARERPAPDDRTLLRALVRACQAVAFAHSRGVVHRDLKPANLMLGGFGETLVMDWGLAAVSGTGVDAGSAGPDPDQAVSGTPAYMAPEQVMGGAAAHAAAVDVYALGAILYELLTLEPPAAGGDAEAVLTAAAGGRIPPARRRAPGRRIPRELEAVAARAMAWDPATRYPGAEALAADLERFLDGRPVLALRVPWPQRAAKAVRRNPALAIAAAAALVLGSLAWGAASVRSADLARAAEADAARAAAAAAAAELRSRILAEEAGRARAAAEQATARALVGLAAERIRQGQAGDAEAMLDQVALHLRGWEWRHLRGAVRQARRMVPAGDGALERLEAECAGWIGSVRGGPLVAWDPDGRERWRQERTAKPLALAVAPAAGLAAAAVGPHALAVLRCRDGATVAALAEAGLGILTVAATTDGAFAWADDRSGLWLWRSGAPPRLLGRTGGRITALAFAPDGRRLAAAGDSERAVAVWDAATGVLRWRRPMESWLHGVAWSADGERLVAWSRSADPGGSYPARILDAADGRERLRLAHRTGVWSALPLADGGLLTGTWDGRLTRWSADGEEMVVRELGCGWIIDIQRLDDGRIAAAGNDGTVRLLAGPGLDPAGVLAGHRGGVRTLAVAAGRIASGGGDGRLGLWDPDRRSSEISLRPGLGAVAPTWLDDIILVRGERRIGVVQGGVIRVLPTPDAPGWERGSWPPTRILVEADGGLAIADPRKESPAVALVGATTPAFTAVSPDGGRIALLDRDGGLGLWDAADGRRIAGQPGPGSFRPTWLRNDRLVAETGGGGVLLLDRNGNRIAALGPAAADPVGSLRQGAAPDPDGRRFLVWGPAIAGVAVFDLDQGRLLHHLADPSLVHRAVWLADGRIAAFSDAASVLWDPATGDTGHGPGIPTANHIQIAVHGAMVATGGEDQLIRLHRAGSWDRPMVLAGHAGVVQDLGFSHDGSRIFSAGSDATVRVWDTADGSERLTIPTDGPALRVAVGPGDRVAVGDHGGTVRILDAPPDQNPPAP